MVFTPTCSTAVGILWKPEFRRQHRRLGPAPRPRPLGGFGQLLFVRQSAAMSPYYMLEDALYELAPRCILRDTGAAKRIRFSQLGHTVLQNFCVRKAVKSVGEIQHKHIVVVNTGKEIFWAMRLCEQRVIKMPLGYNFIWRIPNSWCKKILEDACDQPATVSSLQMASIFRPTEKAVCLTHVIDAKVVRDINDPSDRLFFCSVRPHCERITIRMPQLDLAYRRGGHSMDIFNLPEDIVNKVVERYVVSSANALNSGGLSQIHNLRATCRHFKESVDSVQTRYSQLLHSRVKHALGENSTIEYKRAVRNKVLSLGCNMWDVGLHMAKGQTSLTSLKRKIDCLVSE